MLRVTAGGKPAAAAVVWGWLSLRPGALTGRWAVCIPISTAGEDGAVRFFARAGDRLVADGRGGDGRWGRVRASAAVPWPGALELDSRRVAVRVVDRQGLPVAGIRVADEQGPLGTAAVTGEDGRAEVMAASAGPLRLVALDASLLGRIVRSGAVPAGGVTVTVEPVASVEVAWTAPPATVAVSASWLPAALTGGEPVLLSGGRARLPFWVRQGWVTAFAPGYEAVQSAVAGARSSVVFRPRPAATASGAVVDAHDAPLAGVPVWGAAPWWWPRMGPASSGPSRGRLMPSDLPLAVTGSDGRFAAAGLPPGPLALEARLPGLPPAASPEAEAKPGSTRHVVLKLVPGRTVTLTVVDDAGAPLAGAAAKAFAAPQVTERGGGPVWTAPPRPGDEPAAEAGSNAGGRVTLPGVPLGGVRVELRRRGFVTRWVQGFVTDGGLDLGEQILQRAADIAGRVVDDHDDGIAGAVVFPNPEGLRRPSPDDVRTGPQGYFVLPDQPATGEVQLSAAADGCFSDGPTRVALPAAGPVTVRLHRGRVLEGRVVDRDTGEAIAGAGLGASKDVQSHVGGFAANSTQTARRSETDDDGRFRLEGVPAGKVEVVVRAEGYQRRTVPLDVPRDADPEPVVIALERGLAIRGRVEGADSSPAGGVLVIATTGRGGFDGSGTYSGPDGTFEIEGLARGRYNLRATDDGGATGHTAADAGSDGAVVRLEAPGSLHGTVRTPDGSAPSRCTIRLVGAGNAAEIQTDASGAFTVDDIPAGNVYLVARADGFAAASKQVTVEPGRQASVELELGEAGTVSGRVTGLSPEELQRCVVFASGPTTSPDGGGAFTLRGVRAGHARVTARVLPEGRQRTVTVDVTGDDTTAGVEIDFAGGVTLSGTVTRAGEPAAGLAVTATPVGFRQSPAATTGADGRFEIAGLEPGETDVAVLDETGRTLVGRRLTVSGDTRVDLQVPAGSVGGTVVASADGKPVIQAAVSLDSGAAPHLSRSTVTGDTGAFRFDDLPDGTYTVRATAPGYAPAETTATVSMGAAGDVRLALADESILELVVRDAAGRVPGRVYLRPLRAGRVENGVWLYLDVEGRARTGAFPPGTVTLVVTEPGDGGEALVRVMVPSRGNAVQLAPSGRLDVVVPVGEGGAPAARLRVLTADGLVVPVALWPRSDLSGWVAVGNGRFTVEQPPGAYVVEMIGPDGAHRAQPAALAPGATVTVTFE